MAATDYKSTYIAVSRVIKHKQTPTVISSRSLTVIDRQPSASSYMPSKYCIESQTTCGPNRMADRALAAAHQTIYTNMALTQLTVGYTIRRGRAQQTYTDSTHTISATNCCTLKTSACNNMFITRSNSLCAYICSKN